MPAPATPCDVLVVGGGPAGATAARLLSLWGRDVVLVAKPGTDEPGLPESLTPSCRKFFDLMGISPAIDAAGFVRATGHTIWWGALEKTEPFDGGRLGWQTTTTDLSRVLVGCAEASGVRVVRASLAASDGLAWPARFKIDATGRAGVLARPHGGRRYEPGHRTVALVGTWRSDGGWPVPDPTHTLLESYGDGWAWSVPLADGGRALAVMVDPTTTALARGDGARGVYLSEVSKTERFAEIFRGASLVAGPTGWDASMYIADRLTGPDWLLAGDAGSFVDPLSSAGVRKAMVSGWQTAVVLNTALGQPALKDEAFRTFESRERTTYARFLALTRHFLAQGGAVEQPFWQDRSSEGAPDDRDAVLSAFARIREASAVRLVVAPDVRIESRGSWRERELVLEPQLVTPSTPDGVRYVGSVDLVPLVTLAPRHDQVGDLFAAYEAEMGPTDLRDFLTGLATAVARGWLTGV
jgi:2-polyprenyl-6-methoxyphenol hydroxylase-like FAD-dependent oxidoreductase